MLFGTKFVNILLCERGSEIVISLNQLFTLQTCIAFQGFDKCLETIFGKSCHLIKSLMSLSEKVIGQLYLLKSSSDVGISASIASLCHTFCVGISRYQCLCANFSLIRKMQSGLHQLKFPLFTSGY